MKGKYRIYDGDTLLGEFDNIVTNRGKIAIGRFLSQERSSWSDAIVIGAGSSAPSATNESLDLEFWRDEIDIASYDIPSGQIKLRSRIPAQVVGKIFEIGVYCTLTFDSGTVSGPIVSAFDSLVEPWTGGAENTSDNRVGSASRDLSPSSGSDSAVLDFETDLRAYTSDTVFRLGYIAAAGVSSATVRLKSSATDYREYSFTPTSGGYTVESWRVQDFSVVGNPQWTEIYELEIIASGTGTMTFDALSAIDERPNDVLTVLVSRALVDLNGQNFFQKKSQRELQIEYVLELNI